MNKLNRYFGIFLFLVFLITGYYLKEYFKPEHLNDIHQRLQIRSSHIYILFIALLNITLSKCRFDKTTNLIFYLENSCRMLMILAGIISCLAFCFEHTGEIGNRNLTLLSVLLSLISIGILLLTDLTSKHLKIKNT